MNKKERKNKQINFRVDVKIYDILKEMSLKQNRTISNTVYLIVSDYLVDEKLKK